MADHLSEMNLRAWLLLTQLHFSYHRLKIRIHCFGYSGDGSQMANFSNRRFAGTEGFPKSFHSEIDSQFVPVF